MGLDSRSGLVSGLSSVFFDTHTRTSLARSAENIGPTIVNSLKSRFTLQAPQSEGTYFHDTHKYASIVSSSTDSSLSLGANN